MEEDLSYEMIRNPNLPWGYWCVADPEYEPALVDETGRRWDSLREYLWCGRLSMARRSHWEFVNQLELLLAVLACIDRRIVHIEEHVRDLFKGSWDIAFHYACWLKGHGLSDGFDKLTTEGRAVLVMLASTRPRSAAPTPIGLPTLVPQRGFDRGETREERERIVAVNEKFALNLPARFVRAEIDEFPGIKLIGPPEGANIPLGRVLWSMTFGDDFARDRLFAWLIHRLDRWEAWTELASLQGAQALSEHFLQLRFADEPLEAD